MTVQEAIEILKAMPQDAELRMWSYKGVCNTAPLFTLEYRTVFVDDPLEAEGQGE